jgi:hypothetical protein
VRKTGCPSSKGRPSTLLLAKVVNDSSTKSFISHEYHYFTKKLQECDNFAFHRGANPVLMAETMDRPAYYLSVFDTID